MSVTHIPLLVLNAVAIIAMDRLLDTGFLKHFNNSFFNFSSKLEQMFNIIQQVTIEFLGCFFENVIQM